MTHSRHAYKDIRLQQLRSFCETARLGSLTAAAASLGLAQPTVWEQVHALEHLFGSKLIEREAHGCRLTETGRLLLEFAAPLVAGIDSLPRAVQQAQEQTETWLAIASTPRIFVEDLPPVVVAFGERHPRVHLRLFEMRHEEVATAVESGEADLGLACGPRRCPDNATLRIEPAYELDVILVTPLDHPLARKARVVPGDLLHYPLVNAPSSFPDLAIDAQLSQLGLFLAAPRRLEMSYTATIRRYVALGFGIGLVVGLPQQPPSQELHERSLSRHFGRVNVNLVWRKGEVQHGPIQTFLQILRTTLKSPTS